MNVNLERGIISSRYRYLQTAYISIDGVIYRSGKLKQMPCTLLFCRSRDDTPNVRKHRPRGGSCHCLDRQLRTLFSYCLKPKNSGETCSLFANQFVLNFLLLRTVPPLPTRRDETNTNTEPAGVDHRRGILVSSTSVRQRATSRMKVSTVLYFLHKQARFCLKQPQAIHVMWINAT